MKILKKLSVLGILLLSVVLMLNMFAGCRKEDTPSSEGSSAESITEDGSGTGDPTDASSDASGEPGGPGTTSSGTKPTSPSSVPNIIGSDNDETVKELDMKGVKPVSVGTRQTASNTRLLVNTDNPLFLFRGSDRDSADDVVKLWNRIPSDIRAYSAVFLTYDEYKSNADVIAGFDELLAVTDKKNIPVVLQIEHWNSFEARQAFTQAELSGLLRRHASLKGLAHTELSCMYSEQEEIDRMKTTIRACKENNALFIWLDMEYVQNTNVFARFLEDQELYSLMSSYSHNVVLIDKHNGQGRHFAVQSAAMGAWLSGVCDNWGSNVESWLWWEEGLGLYDDMGGTFRSFHDDYTKEYPASMAGMDTLNDAIGGATVYSYEQLTMSAVNADGETVLTPAFYNVLYPIYQKIVSKKLIPTKAQVAEQVKVAYQYSNIDSEDTAGFESPLLVDLYGPTTDHMNTYRRLRVSKKWLPTTGRYYIIPSLLKQVDASKVLPGAAVVNSGNYASLLGDTAASKQAYFNSKYTETYKGSATMYTINGYSYILNSHENKTINAHQDASFTLKKKANMTVDLPEHSYVMLYDNSDSLKLELYNYRYDARKFFDKKERWDMFIDEYLEGGKDSNPADFRTTTFMIRGLSKKPSCTISGSNNAKAAVQWDADSKTLTVQVTSNGVVYVELSGM